MKVFLKVLLKLFVGTLQFAIAATFMVVVGFIMIYSPTLIFLKLMHDERAAGILTRVFLDLRPWVFWSFGVFMVYALILIVTVQNPKKEKRSPGSSPYV